MSTISTKSKFFRIFLKNSLFALLLISFFLIIFNNKTSFCQEKTLTIRVAHYGENFTTIKQWTWSELESFGLETYNYTYIDRMPAPVNQIARGITLNKILRKAGIDEDSVQRFYFNAEDNYNSMADYTADLLLRANRYYYPNLIDTWDETLMRPGFGAETSKVKVPAMIALAEYFERFGEAGRTDLMTDNSAPRLCYGMVSPYEDALGAHASVKNIVSIDILLVGNNSEDNGENIGSEKTDKPNDDSGDNNGQDKLDEKNDTSSADISADISADKSVDTGDTYIGGKLIPINFSSETESTAWTNQVKKTNRGVSIKKASLLFRWAVYGTLMFLVLLGFIYKPLSKRIWKRKK